MESFDLYKDISERTQGDIYIGVVGPVRTGKSTFIKRFMDLAVIPNMENQYNIERTRDELPQSATGKTIMTTEPKFVPAEAVEVKLDDTSSFNVRMIDCVGYLVPGALGNLDGDEPRMVSTPWSDDKMPFVEAAELGTHKVIAEHSTIGIVITTDGSITEIPRDAYVEAEARVIKELKDIGKPFAVVLNSTNPYSGETEELRKELTETYHVPVIAVNCSQLKLDDINVIIEKVLNEFPIKELNFDFPKWIETLSSDHWLKIEMVKAVKDVMCSVDKLREIKSNVSKFEENEYIKKAYVDKISLGDGSAKIEVTVDDSLFYKILTETTDMNIEDEVQLISTIKILSEAKKEYDKFKFAISEVNRRGYGIVTPVIDEMKIEEPVIVKHGSKYGVKLKATAPSIHMIRADIETEISPIVGTEKQSEELITYFTNEMKDNPSNIWDLNMFGKSMYDLVNDGLQNKLYRMPEDAQMKLQETLQRIINEGSGGLICIIL